MEQGMLDLKVEFLPPSEEEGRECWVVRCPEIDLATQGDTFEEACENIKDAFEGWLWACVTRGTLEKVLAECGFSHCRIEKIKKFVPAAFQKRETAQLCHA